MMNCDWWPFSYPPKFQTGKVENHVSTCFKACYS
uniref:Uncharacterized protein n=1 Tax=Arundo donax TaxID=35708 RepID=A0A0A9F2Z4_ARUDO